MTGRIRMLGASLGFIAGMSVAVAQADEAAEAAKNDMAATLGPDAVELSILPDAFFASTWAQGKALWIEGKYAIPPKYRALIGLAVSSQIPCSYCVYADTSDSRLFGATDQEMKEAIMFAAMTREWSTVLNGNMVDMTAWRKEIDAGAAAAREAMAKGPPK